MSGSSEKKAAAKVFKEKSTAELLVTSKDVTAWEATAGLSAKPVMLGRVSHHLSAMLKESSLCKTFE